MMDLQSMATSRKQTLLSELQSFGLKLESSNEDGLARKGGAGPTDHRAVTFMGTTVMVPVLNEAAAQSPFTARYSGKEAILFYEGVSVGQLSFPAQPKFYKKAAEDGTPYWKIARLHSKDVLATTVLQTCIRYGAKATKCQFCAIGESLKHGMTIPRKSPQQLAEVARAAMEMDGIKNVVMTTGTPVTSDRGAAILAECARAIKEATGLPIQAQCEPPADFSWFRTLKQAGVDSLGMHLEAWDQRVREKIMPGKAEVDVDTYLRAFESAVKVFGRGEVSTYLLAGLGDSREGLIEGARTLIDLGVYPFIVPFVPVTGTELADHPSPKPEFMRSVLEPVGEMLKKAGMISENLSSGCAKCGACSTLSLYEKTSTSKMENSLCHQ